MMPMAKRKRTIEEWRRIIKDQEASGLTQIKWCEMHGINYDTYRGSVCNIRNLDKASKNIHSTNQTENETINSRNQKKHSRKSLILEKRKKTYLAKPNGWKFTQKRVNLKVV